MLRETLLIIRLVSKLIFFSVAIRKKSVWFRFLAKCTKRSKIPDTVNYEEKQTVWFRVNSRLILYFTDAVFFHVWNISTYMEQ